MIDPDFTKAMAHAAAAAARKGEVITWAHWNAGHLQVRTSRVKPAPADPQGALL